MKSLLPILMCTLLPLSVLGTSGASAQAQSASQPTVEVYRYRNDRGVVSFSDRAPRGTRYEVLRYNCFACDLQSQVDWHETPLFVRRFRDIIDQAAYQHGVDPALVRAVIHAESAFRPKALSPKGAQGLMQLMPATAQDLGVTDAFLPEQNIDGGVRYLAGLLAQHHGDVRLATAAYNAGPGAVRRHRGVPPFEETRTYIKRVEILHQRYQEALRVANTDEMAASAVAGTQ
ncbi:lytic transglycosylase domain-containing protein [Marinimicrobium sp. ABcell2]|uniref:lytic transglycosylase domain-containing protein n=1 Tax=Marinimicrobium sp. ABcell2 TaxID=3069751 RepID=UPI0027B14D41|nr:lytic transglycosylase domain-containing protein [Marinimicrobium sp. ABcell2]MDQ2075133.1 lytic transglycosylase domain-containing protein [Marinimicrobium sp. ABcell2]